MARYKVYGYVLETEHPLVSCLDDTDESPDLIFSLVDSPPPPSELSPAYQSSLPGFGDEAAFSLYRAADHFTLRYSGSAEFYIRRDRIDCHLLDPQYEYWVEIALLGPVMSFWLEMRGHIAIHASAVVVDGEAVGMMAASKSGKTSLAASMMRAGGALLSDDILPLSLLNGRPVARPGYPQMRMWPDQAQRFIANYQTLPLAHPDHDKRRVRARDIGRFHEAPAPLSAILIPERRDEPSAPELTSVPKAEALFTLLRGSFAASVLESLPDFQKRRLSQLSDILRYVPVYRFTYPAGYDRLDDVREWLLDRLTAISSNSMVG
jgi:hypothetical protein